MKIFERVPFNPFIMFLLTYNDTVSKIAYWNKTPSAGRRLEWGPEPFKIAPQLCLNSPGVKNAVKKRAQIIGLAIKEEVEKLKKIDKEYLYAGVIHRPLGFYRLFQSDESGLLLVTLLQRCYRLIGGRGKLAQTREQPQVFAVEGSFIGVGNCPDCADAFPAT